MKSGIWAPILATLISLYGIGASTYLTLTHYFKSAVPLACSDNGVVNCAKVTSSPQSYIFHIPVALLGLVFFVPMFAMSLPIVWRNKSKALAFIRLFAVISGMGFVLYLVSMELLVIKAICLWCTSVHIATFLLFLVVLFGWNSTGYQRQKWNY
ncbi:MAG: vitamin K epoxide reductase family protein [Acidimicrobiales bacterium]|nr:vitamin K epoxide reductase family protein [Acidimicrobiales bacterium]